MAEFKEWLIERFLIERKRFDRSGVYAYTQRTMAYNSNKIEGSTLTPEQTASLFDNGTLPCSDDYYRAKDVEEMNGHFLMFNYMLDTLTEELSIFYIVEIRKKKAKENEHKRKQMPGIGVYPWIISACNGTYIKYKGRTWCIADHFGGIFSFRDHRDQFRQYDTDLVYHFRAG